MEILVLDIETCGFTPTAPMVEVGITKLNLETGEREIVYNELVKESHLNDTHKNSWVFQNTSLKFEDVMNAKPLDKVAIQKLLNDYKVTAFNKKFDFAFFRNRGFVFEELDCPMLVAVNVCKILDKTGKKYKWPKVEEAWNFLFPDEEYVELHRGADDSFHEAKIVHELYKRGHFIVE